MAAISLITLLATIIIKLLLLLLALLIVKKLVQSDNNLMITATRKDYEISFLGEAINIASNVDINSNMLKKRRACALHFFGGNCFKA